ncbi:MAG: dihydrolipoamide succinyltransferase, partial [Chitinophagia bacterium]|nr:dihydrolipoamide succinyltransferase [Chitinophagia bacterium]
MIVIKVPSVGESISEVTLVKWIKKEGEYAKRDEVLCELESEKATFELTAEQAGTLHQIAEEGATLKIGDVACEIDETASAPAGMPAPSAPAEKSAPKEVAVSHAPATPPATPAKSTPLAAAIIQDKHLDTKSLSGTGSGGKILKQDVINLLSKTKPSQAAIDRTERKDKMSNLRKTVSRRLVEAKNSTAMLTTFNEVDMTKIMEVRKLYKDVFKETHTVNLGFMSFFTKACCTALLEWPAVNAYIDGEQIVYHEYCDISIAVSAPKGLVVPVIR